MQMLTEADDGRCIELAPDEAFQLSLPENPTSGYGWDMETAPGPVLEPLGDAFRVGSEAVGSGGRVEFEFRGHHPGAITLCLRQWRPWAGEESVIARYHLQIRVRE
jgi:inhibitor of cysteine peptidase